MIVPLHRRKGTSDMDEISECIERSGTHMKLVKISRGLVRIGLFRDCAPLMKLSPGVLLEAVPYKGCTCHGMLSDRQSLPDAS